MYIIIRCYANGKRMKQVQHVSGIRATHFDPAKAIKFVSGEEANAFIETHWHAFSAKERNEYIPVCID